MKPDVTFVKVMNGLAQPALLSFLKYLMKVGYLNIIINMYVIHSSFLNIIINMYDSESRLPEYHYKHVRHTPAQINDCTREVDDLQPRNANKESSKRR